MATVELRLIATTDVHAHVHPYDYYRDAPDETTGLAKAATLIARARAEAPNSLLFDNGDLIQGSPLGDWAAEALARGEIATHPMIPAMSALRYDAATVGNHEFNYGLDTLAKALGGAPFPFVCCNVLKPDGASYFTPWTLLEKQVRDADGAAHVLKIGVVGFVTPDIVRWDMSHVAGRATTAPIVEAARQHIPACRAAGAAVIVALCHAGVSKIGPAGAGENAGLTLAQVGGLDALFVGHQHLQLPGADFAGLPGVDAQAGRLAGVPAAMAGFWAGHIGVIDLTLEFLDVVPAKAGTQGERTSVSSWVPAFAETTVPPTPWRVTSAKVELRAVEPTTLADPAVLAATQGAHAATLAYVRAPVGEMAAPLASYFAMIGDDASVRVVHDAQLAYVRALMDSVPALRKAPLLSASAPFKCGGRNGAAYYTDVPAGPIALRHVADLYVYPNGLRVVEVTGATIREWLERAASVFQTLDPALTTPQPLLAPSFAAYDFDSIDGVGYRLDLTQPARYDDQGRVIAPNARRVVDLSFERQPLDGQATFLVVTNSYRASGGGHFPGCDGTSVIYEAPDSNFDALLHYVKGQSRVRVSPGGGWRLALWPASVTATLLAPPAAAGFATPPGVSAASLGPGPDGFELFRITAA